MTFCKYRGMRFRASDKSLVYRFCTARRMRAAEMTLWKVISHRNKPLVKFSPILVNEPSIVRKSV